jgi:hypothetical protein
MSIPFAGQEKRAPDRAIARKPLLGYEKLSTIWTSPSLQSPILQPVLALSASDGYVEPSHDGSLRNQMGAAFAARVFGSSPVSVTVEN